MSKIAILSLIFVSYLSALDIQDSYYKSYNYEKMGDYKDAIKSLVPVYKKFPKGYTLNLRLGYLFYLDKKYNNSINHYKKASNIAPYSVEARLGLIKNYIKKGKYDNALAISNSIIKMDYYNYYGNFYQLVALSLKGEKDNAIKVANKMLALYPTDIMYLQELAKLIYQKDKKRAKKLFEDILILDPNNIVAKEYLNR
jgi:tetratricopeptide (TPR) repeat protein